MGSSHIAQGDQLRALWPPRGVGREGEREGDTRGKRYGHICICITDSLCYKAETNTPLWSNYTPIKMLKKKKCLVEIKELCKCEVLLAYTWTFTDHFFFFFGYEVLLPPFYVFITSCFRSFNVLSNIRTIMQWGD